MLGDGLWPICPTSLDGEAVKALRLCWTVSLRNRNRKVSNLPGNHLQTVLIYYQMCEVSVDVLNWISAQCECTQDKGCLNLVWFGHIGNETIYCRQTDS